MQNKEEKNSYTSHTFGEISLKKIRAQERTFQLKRQIIAME